MTCCCPTCGHELPGVDGIRFDYESGIIQVNDWATQLAPREADLMKVLLDAYPHTLRRWAILDAIYGSHKDTPMEKVIDVMACKMRHKLEGSGVTIKSVRSRGYALSFTEQRVEAAE